MNDYDKISSEYKISHEKPDKKYSILPTSLSILTPIEGKIVIDVGCGDGFFTKQFAKKAKLVYGIDNSNEQIFNANKIKISNVKYILSDMNEFNYPHGDIIFSPFVLNYLKEEEKLQNLFVKFYQSLNKNGIFAGIIDTPLNNIHDMKKFGSIKRINKLLEGENIIIELYDSNQNYITTLNSFYHEKKTIEKILLKVGFSDIMWHTPIVSKEGIELLGKDYWREYLEKCDLAYFSAKK